MNKCWLVSKILIVQIYLMLYMFPFIIVIFYINPKKFSYCIKYINKNIELNAHKLISNLKCNHTI